MDLGPSLREIGCFVAVADLLSFSRAAKRLRLSQPAVSQSIARLERELGLRLLERTSREVQLTDSGKVLLPYAEALLAGACAFSAEAARLADPGSRTIRLAYCPVVGTLAARVARRLARRSPGVGVELHPAGWGAASAGLVEGATAAALMSAPFPPGFATTARFSVPVGHVAVPAASPLATASRLDLGQLAGAGVLLPRSRPAGSLWARLDALLPAGARYRITVDELDDLPTAVDLVAAGRGALVVPSLLAGAVRRPDVSFVRLATSELHLTYGLVWRRHDASAELMGLVQAVQEVHRNQLGGSAG